MLLFGNSCVINLPPHHHLLNDAWQFMKFAARNYNEYWALGCIELYV